MSEWQGPWKCTKCGTIRDDPELEDHEKDDGWICRGGTWKPYDRRRAAPGVVEELRTVDDARMVKHIATRFGISTPESDEISEVQFLSLVRQILAILCEGH